MLHIVLHLYRRLSKNRANVKGYWVTFWIFTGTLANDKELLGPAQPCIFFSYLTLFCTSYNTGFKSPTVAFLGTLDGSLWTFPLIFTFPSPSAFLQNQQEVCCPGLCGSYTSVARNSIHLLLNPQGLFLNEKSLYSCGTSSFEVLGCFTFAYS